MTPNKARLDRLKAFSRGTPIGRVYWDAPIKLDALRRDIADTLRDEGLDERAQRPSTD